MRIDRNESIGHLAARCPEAVGLFEAWGIDYCCGGQQRIDEACAGIGVTVSELARELEAVQARVMSPQKSWLDAPIPDLLRFIVEEHHVYSRDELSLLERLSRKVFDAHGAHHPELALVSSLISELADEMLPHMEREEEVLFPYVEQLWRESEYGTAAPAPFFGHVGNPIKVMQEEHEAVGRAFARLRAASDEYDLPEEACASYALLFERLQRMEARTHEHIHLENNVLFPRSLHLEARRETRDAPAAR